MKIDKKLEQIRVLKQQLADVERLAKRQYRLSKKDEWTDKQEEDSFRDVREIQAILSAMEARIKSLN